MTEKKRRSLGAPPADWLTQSDIVLRGSAETQRLTRIGGPPPEFGDSRTKPRSAGPLTALVVSEDRDVAARLAISLASAQVSIRLALALADVESLLEGATVVFVVVPGAEHSLARSIKKWGDGRSVFALVRDRGTADALRGSCDVAIEPPWDIEAVVGALSK